MLLLTLVEDARLSDDDPFQLLRIMHEIVLADAVTPAFGIALHARSVPQHRAEIRAVIRSVVNVQVATAKALLDDWLGGHDPTTPVRLADRVRLPKGHWLGERAARDILALAGKGRAFRSLGPLIARQGGQQVLYGSALALAATVRIWSNDTGTPVPELARTAIR